MTQTAIPDMRSRVLSCYRAYRHDRMTPHMAMMAVHTAMAELCARHTLNQRPIAALEDAACTAEAENYLACIDDAAMLLPYWRTGTIGKPIPPMPGDPCTVCGVDHDNHRDRVLFHAHRSSL